MPNMITGVRGYTGLTQATRLVLEPTSGEQVLMAQTVGASTMSLTTQPNTLSPTTGMHLHVYVIGNVTSGTMTFAGTNPSGGSITSQTYHISAAPQNNTGYTEFCTSEIFATISSSGVTLTGLTPCQILIMGSCAAKNLLPITSDSEEQIGHFSPDDKRGILWKNFRVQQLTKTVSLDKFDCTLYPDSLWAAYMGISTTPSITTVPASPVSLLTSTTIAATMTLTTQPTSPGMFFIFTVTGNSTAGTFVLAGSDNRGTSAGETINVSAGNGTFYSTKRYSSLTSNQFTTTGMTGASVTVTGVYAWKYDFVFDGVNNYTPYSACLEIFNGVFGVKLPYTIFSDIGFDWQKEKSLEFTAKGESQDYLIVGDPNPTTSTSGTNPFPTLAQPTSLPIVSWPSSFYLDLGTGTPLTTQDGSMLTFKADITTGRKSYYTGDGFQRWNNVTFDSAPDYSITATVLLQNYQNYINLFKQNIACIFGAMFTGALLGSIGTNTYYENWTFTFPGKIDTDKNDYSKNPVEGAIKVMSEYNFNLGYAFKLSITTQTPPTYTA